MNNLPLKPLKWQRIDIENLSGIYCGKTESYIKDAVSFCNTPVAEYVIRKDGETGKYVANYGGRNENTYDTIDEAEHWAEHTHYASKMQPYVKPDSITDIANWFKAAKPEPTDKDRLTQIGCHYEEVSEMMVACHGVEHMGSSVMNNCANGYKAVHEHVVSVMQPVNELELLDALCDQIVTATGVAYMMGFDIEGALKEVIRSNNSKMVNGKFEFDDNGKIQKPESYSEPKLDKFVGGGDD
ncbi:nucleoside triphosphate pyrophosphohydrolase family protein [Psychrobacter celer]|uniref:nucleoside triphosphate pyrophosphohydrolase family protein n=1 Tax=Psychrobacter celer TaxID=306572 RepID=UPI003FD3A20E